VTGATRNTGFDIGLIAQFGAGIGCRGILSMSYIVSEQLIRTVGRTPQGADWLATVPGSVTELARRWLLTIARPFENEATCSWVAPCTRADGTPAVLKLGFPHKEAEHEIEGLAYWAGEPTVNLLEADSELSAMLLERCEPGTELRTLAEDEQDTILAGLLKRLWKIPEKPHPFRPLAEMFDYWCEESRNKSYLWPDKAIVEDGMSVFQDLLSDCSEEVLLATDLHAGNVLRAQRMPWLVIDPKPFVGDQCYDATQHLMNCKNRLRENPLKTIARIANRFGVDERHVRLWTFARLAVETGRDMVASHSLARRLSV